MLKKDIRIFLSNIGKIGGRKTAATHNMSEIARLGGLKKGENARRRKGELSTSEWKPYGQK